MPKKRKNINSTSPSKEKKQQEHIKKWSQLVDVEENLLEIILALKSSLDDGTYGDRSKESVRLENDYANRIQCFIRRPYPSPIQEILINRKEALISLISLNRLLVDEPSSEKKSELESLIETLSSHLEYIKKHDKFLKKKEIEEHHIRYAIIKSLANAHEYLALLSLKNKNTDSPTDIIDTSVNLHKRLYWLLKEKEHTVTRHNKPLNDIEPIIEKTSVNLRESLTHIQNYFLSSSQQLSKTPLKFKSLEDLIQQLPVEPVSSDRTLSSSPSQQNTLTPQKQSLEGRSSQDLDDIVKIEKESLEKMSSNELSKNHFNLVAIDYHSKMQCAIESYFRTSTFNEEISKNLIYRQHAFNPLITFNQLPFEDLSLDSKLQKAADLTSKLDIHLQYIENENDFLNAMGISEEHIRRGIVRSFINTYHRLALLIWKNKNRCSFTEIAGLVISLHKQYLYLLGEKEHTSTFGQKPLNDRIEETLKNLQRAFRFIKKKYATEENLKPNERSMLSYVKDLECLIAKRQVTFFPSANQATFFFRPDNIGDKRQSLEENASLDQEKPMNLSAKRIKI